MAPDISDMRICVELMFSIEGETRYLIARRDERKVVSGADLRSVVLAYPDAFDVSLRPDGGFNREDGSPVPHSLFLTGNALRAACADILRYERRDAYAALDEYCASAAHSTICVVYGLRSTGKTVLLKQLAHEHLTRGVKVAYASLGYAIAMSTVLYEARVLAESGYKLLIIDEASAADGFVDGAAVLADTINPLGAKVIVSGTDSLSFHRARQDELYHRALFVRTTFMAYAEYTRILGGDVLSYIKSGGVFWRELPDITIDEYLRTSVISNVYNSIRNMDRRAYENDVLIGYSKSELYELVCAILDFVTGSYVISRAAELRGQRFARGLRQAMARNQIRIEYDAYKAVREMAMPFEVTGGAFDKAGTEETLRCLFALDLLWRYEYLRGGAWESGIGFTQCGVAREFVRNSILAVYRSGAFIGGEREMQVALDEVTDGEMLESAVLRHTCALKTNDVRVFKYRTADGGVEFDVCVFRITDGALRLIEVKRRDTFYADFVRHLTNDAALGELMDVLGGVTSVERILLYRGATCERVFNEKPIHCVNIEEYLLFPAAQARV
jgi:predicted AAA+ superfamily ATPase